MSDNYTPKNEWEVQYIREYKRITQAIRRQKKLGYFVPENVKPLPPSKVKVMSPLEVEKLVNLTPNEIRKKSVQISKETGEGNKATNNVNPNNLVKIHHSPIEELKVRKNIGQIKLPPQPKEKKPKTELEKQYAREYRRITSAIRREKKRGYYVPEDIRPIPPSQMVSISPTDVELLTKLTPSYIRKNSVWIDPETGEEYPGLDVVKSNRTQRKRKKKEHKEPENTAPPKENNLNSQIINTINNLLAEWQPAPYWHASFFERKTLNYHRISTLWQETLSKEGEYEVAYRLEANATEFIRLVERLLYASDSTVENDFNMGRFIELLINRPLTAEESDAYTESAREAAMDSLRGENSIG